MLTFSGYVKDILKQIKSSHEIFENLDDKPGDLDIMKKEWIKVDSLLNSLIKRIENSENTSDVYQNLAKKCKYYTENYYFHREIEIMSDLYANDPHRLKNIRLKILESFNDKKFMERITETIEKLEQM